MKKIYFKLLFFVLAIFSTGYGVDAQCIPTGVRPVFGTVTGSTGTQTFTNVPTGNVVRITAPAAGVFYTISLCSTNGGVPQADGVDDSQLTILNLNSAAATDLAFNDDFCPTTGPNGFGPSEVTYTSTAAGDVFVYLTEWNAGGTLDCIADGVNNSYVMTVTKSAPPTCDAGVLTSPLTQNLCPGVLGNLTATGSSTPGDYTVGFSDASGGTGGSPGGFEITGITTLPYTFDEDLNGVLSFNNLPVLEGTWILTLYATDAGGTNCDSTVVTTVNFLDANNAACGGTGFDASIDFAFISEYTGVPLAHAGSYFPSCIVSNAGANPVTGISVATTIYDNLGASLYTATLTQATLAAGSNTTLTASAAFTPTAVDFYLVEFIVSINEADGDILNDTLYTAIDITDSLYVRDFAYLTGNVDGAVGVGTGLTMEFGNVFDVTTATTLVAVDAFFNETLVVGDVINARVYNFAANTVGSQVTLLSKTITAADLPVDVLTFNFNQSLAPGQYFMAIEETGPVDNMGILYSNEVYTTNRIIADIDGSGFDDVEVLTGGQFRIVPLVRANLYTPPTLCSITDIAAGTQTPCVSSTNQYTQQVTVTYSNPPATGQLNVNGQIFAITSSPQTVTLTGLTAGGGNVDVLAFFSAQTTCTYAENNVFVAPAACNVCTISDLAAGTQTPCVSSNNTYTQQVIVTYANAPATGSLNVNGQTFPITTSPQTVTLTGLTANGALVNVTAFFTAQTACTFTLNNVFTAAASCACVPMTLTASTTPVLCSQAGAIDLTVSGGTGAYSYSWSPGGAITQDISGLTSGSYTVTVTDAQLCTATLPVTVANNSYNLGVSVNTTPVSNCSAPNGTASAVVTGSTGALTYAWTPSTFGSSATISNVPSGSYSVIVTDANGCTGTGSGAVSNSSGVNASVNNLVNVTCNGGMNGTIGLTATGGTAPITYTWSDQNFPSAIATRTNLMAGPYTITVADAAGCSVVLGPITLTQPSALVVALANSSNATCNTVNNGSIDMNVSGGTAPYSYSWTNSASSSQDLSGLGAGTYQLTVTDANSCPSVQGPAVSITQPSALSVSVNAGSVNNVSCNGGSNGSFTAVAAGGTAPYTYTVGTITNVTGIFTGLTASNYTVSVSDANSCPVAVASQAITQPAALTVSSAGVTPVSCSDVADGSIDMNVSGGTAPYSYSWTNTPATTEDLSGLAAGSYTLTVTDANGCSGASTPVVVADAVAISTTISATPASSNTSADGTASVVATGGAGNFTYSWDDANGQTTATAVGLTSSNYTVEVTDANGCSAIDAIFVDFGSAINELNVNDLNIYPNPADKNIMVSFSLNDSKNITISFYSAIGNLILNEEVNVNALYSKSYDVSALSSGVYFIELSGEEGKVVKRFVINR